MKKERILTGINNILSIVYLTLFIVSLAMIMIVVTMLLSDCIGVNDVISLTLIDTILFIVLIYLVW